ncbi:MAG: hydrolase [Planctomycetes bacterium]|nr:hydrolase [Planctomycetota bacterium]
MKTTCQEVPAKAAELRVAVGPALLPATLLAPRRARGLVLLVQAEGGRGPAHGTADLASALAADGWGMLAIDLLTPAERAARADVALLAARLGQVTAWVDRQEEIAGAPVVYVGVGPAAAAALVAAAFLGERVRAVITLDGRPDLAGPFLGHVRAPTLLLVGSGADATTRQLHRQAVTLLGGRVELVALPEVAPAQEVVRRATGWLREVQVTGSQA